MKLSSMLFLILILANPLAWGAEDADNEELNIIELELEKSAPQIRERRDEEVSQKPEANAVNEFSDLGNLAPFAEVSVIQKRYFPKSGRTQFFGGVSLTTNDPFYNSYGFTLKPSYFFTEKWGAEVSFFSMSSSEAKATKELLAIQNVGTDSLSYTKQFLGLSLIYVPIYGKMALHNKKIIPFDLYFGIGGGNTKTQSKDGIGTFHFSTGQLFAVTKSFGLRWDFSWNFFSARAIGEDGMINNLFLSVGASYFIPEAKYR